MYKVQKDNPDLVFQRIDFDGEKCTLVFRERIYLEDGSEAIFTSDRAYENYLRKEVKK